MDTIDRIRIEAGSVYEVTTDEIWFAWKGGNRWPMYLGDILLALENTREKHSAIDVLMKGQVLEVDLAYMIAVGAAREL